MLTDADIKAGNLIREIYAELYHEDDDANRVLGPDDDKRLADIAIDEPVVRIFPCARGKNEGSFKVYGCMFDVAAPTFDMARRLVEKAEAALEPNPRSPKQVSAPIIEPVRGTQYTLYRVTFNLTTK